MAQENRPGAPKSVRPRTKGRPIWLDRRWGQCRCGWVDVYSISRTLTGKGSSELDPGRLMNQRCTGCGDRLGRGAARRIEDMPLAVRRERRALQRQQHRHVDRLAVSMSLDRKGPAGSTVETPAKTSANGVAPRPGPATDVLERERLERGRQAVIAQGKKLREARERGERRIGDL